MEKQNSARSTSVFANCMLCFFTCCAGRVQLCVCFYLLMFTYQKGIFEFQNVGLLYLLFSVIILNPLGRCGYRHYLSS